MEEKKESLQVESIKDILLLLLYVPGPSGKLFEPIKGRTRIAKLLFLFQEEVSKKYGFDKLIKNTIQFVSDRFGPFSEEVYQCLDFLINVNAIETIEIKGELSRAELVELLKIREELAADVSEADTSYVEFEEQELKLTNKGTRLAEFMYSGLEEKQKEALTLFKKKYGGISLFSLLEYVYKTYPKYTSESEIKGKFLH